MTTPTPSTAPTTVPPLAADPLELLRQLVRIDSVNPDLVPGAAGESAIADFVGDWLGARGFTIHRLEERPGRPSVVAVAAGTGAGRSLMLNGHLDIVTLTGYDGEPLDPVETDGKLFGRGTFDMKAGIAAMMVAAATAATAEHRGDIVLALVADEEFASAGTEEVLRTFHADAAIVSEPTHEDLVVAHKGFAWFDVTVHGTAAHGSRPDLGVDAITRTGPFLTGLEQLAQQLAAQPGHPLLGPGSVHASLITGGEELSSYPARCTVSLERRTIPGEDAETIRAQLQAILDRITAQNPDFAAQITPGLERQPFDVAEDAPIVRSVAAAFEAETGIAPTLRGEAFWTDAALLSQAGIPSLLFGVDGSGAHAATEWVEIDSLMRVSRVLLRTITHFCA